MAIIKSIRCNDCGFQLLWGSGVVPYVRLPPGTIRKLFGIKGEKVLLKEPPVGGHNIKLAGKSIANLIEEGRIGHYATYICLECLNLFQLDSDSVRICNKCKSDNVKSVFDLIGQKCPKCRLGIIEEKTVGIS
ncbi:MAG: hypothetical protein U9R17_07295 [Thermodesulfobacteriota bacterium]|nr:hypothetical protein [Thermodesulfobacteriota bacterium]